MQFTSLSAVLRFVVMSEVFAKENPAVKIGEIHRLKRVMKAPDAAEQLQNNHRVESDLDC